jgi:hypothetical protein
MTSIDHLISESELAPATVHEEIAAAFHMWEGAQSISASARHPGERANILIGAQTEPQGSAFADISYHSSSTGRVKAISLARICLNPAKRWKIGFDGNNVGGGWDYWQAGRTELDLQPGSAIL